LCLENIRNNGKKKLEDSPRALLLGTGRNICTRTLTNYAIRQERSPLIVDLDVTNGNLLFPGVVTCSTINRLIEPEEGLNISNPLAYYYFSPNWNDNPRYFFQLVSSIGKQIYERLAHVQNLSNISDKNKYSGLLGIFSGWIGGKFEKLLEHSLKAFRINLIVVVGNEGLYNFIKKDHESAELKILSISKSPGLVTKDAPYRRYQTSRRIKEYFYDLAMNIIPILKQSDSRNWKY
jgi:polynucleotide 5'-kinase involved in rRNA processing